MVEHGIVASSPACTSTPCKRGPAIGVGFHCPDRIGDAPVLCSISLISPAALSDQCNQSSVAEIWAGGSRRDRLQCVTGDPRCHERRGHPRRPLREPVQPVAQLVLAVASLEGLERGGRRPLASRSKAMILLNCPGGSPISHSRTVSFWSGAAIRRAFAPRGARRWRVVQLMGQPGGEFTKRRHLFLLLEQAGEPLSPFGRHAQHLGR